ncbi:MAG: DUF2950 domain-containing protein [Hyphomicrobiales bacterium]
MAHGVVQVRWVSVIGAALLLWCSSAVAQERFDTPENAVEALVTAAKDGSREKLLEILGPDGEDIISSGDEVADRNARDSFIAGYDEKHGLEPDGDDKTILVMGDENWPFPIPIVKKDGTWAFDSAAGLEEILLRRIGRNELAAIQSSLAYVAAQNDYAALDVDGKNPPPYAQRIVSTPGEKDGLYWPAAEGEDQSPLGELFAEATAEGYKPGEKPIPYHGYYYRVLTRQGAGAEGGAYDYVVDGRMIGGFGLLAYPAQYGNSGIMTFMVNQDGVVFQKDLGPKTEKLAGKIKAFAPESGWTKAETP